MGVTSLTACELFSETHKSNFFCWAWKWFFVFDIFFTLLFLDRARELLISTLREFKNKNRWRNKIYNKNISEREAQKKLDPKELRARIVWTPLQNIFPVSQLSGCVVESSCDCFNDIFFYKKVFNTQSSGTRGDFFLFILCFFFHRYIFFLSESRSLSSKQFDCFGLDCVGTHFQSLTGFSTSKNSALGFIV